MKHKINRGGGIQLFGEWLEKGSKCEILKGARLLS